MRIINNDCLVAMKEMPDNSVDAIVTDPPYGLSFMGKKWDYDVPSQEIWEECLRVLKPGGYLLAFAGTRTQHRMAVRIEDAGFEIRDMIAWIYGSGFPKSLNIGKAVDKIQGNERETIATVKNAGIKAMPDGRESRSQVAWERESKGTMDLTKGTSEWEGWGTSLKPALEPITVARKPIEGNVAQNCLKWGVGGINIDGCRVGTEQLGGGTMPDLRDVGAMSKEAIGIDKLSCGQNSRPATRKEQPTYTGRFPANLIHDSSDEVVGLFPQTKSGTAVRGKLTVSHFGHQATPLEDLGYNDSGSAARFFYAAKASKAERNRGCEDMEEVIHNDGRDESLDSGHMPQNRSNTPKKNFHPTVKPIALMEYLVKLVSKEGHTVLDPFMGSGSTGIACKKLGREFIGIEKESDYCKIAEARIGAVQTVQEELL